MSAQTDLYMNSAKAFNNFFSMLHLAMLESMPGVEISGSGDGVGGVIVLIHLKN